MNSLKIYLEDTGYIFCCNFRRWFSGLPVKHITCTLADFFLNACIILVLNVNEITDGFRGILSGKNFEWTMMIYKIRTNPLFQQILISWNVISMDPRNVCNSWKEATASKKFGNHWVSLWRSYVLVSKHMHWQSTGCWVGKHFPPHTTPTWTQFQTVFHMTTLLLLMVGRLVS